MRVTTVFGLAAIFALGTACSSAGQTPLPEENPGDENPETPAAGDQSPSDTANGDNNKAPTNPTTPTNPTNPTTPTTPADPPAPKPKSIMTFFVTSTGSAALGGNIGGLAGADKKCQDLAAAATISGADHTWHAYLSITGTSAKDRIGTGPWTNQKGKVISPTVAALHDYQFIPANADLVDEKGTAIPLTAVSILTGSKQDGTPALQNCANWTSAAQNTQGHVGDAASDTSVQLGSRWNDAVKNSACTQAGLQANKGEGRLYCFAID